jgi:hypothetical protein
MMSDQDAVDILKRLEGSQVTTEGSGGEQISGKDEISRPAADVRVGFGDCAESSPVQEQQRVSTATDAAPIASTILATGTAAATSEEDFDDDFGDFESSSGATAVPVPQIAAAGTQPPLSAAMPSTSSVHSATSGAAAAPAAAAAVAAASAAELPDILQLSGSDFLHAVLEAWQVSPIFMAKRDL